MVGPFSLSLSLFVSTVCLWMSVSVSHSLNYGEEERLLERRQWESSRVQLFQLSWWVIGVFLETRRVHGFSFLSSSPLSSVSGDICWPLLRWQKRKRERNRKTRLENELIRENNDVRCKDGEKEREGDSRTTNTSTCCSKSVYLSLIDIHKYPFLFFPSFLLFAFLFRKAKMNEKGAKRERARERERHGHF